MLRLQARGLSRPWIRRIQTFDVIESQVNVLRDGKTVLTQGSGGRSSRTGYTVTVFGAPGYVGTSLVTKLARQGTLMVCPFRDEHFSRHLKPTGDLGIVNFQEFDLRNTKSIEDSLKHSDVVVNLVGRDWETKNFSFYDVHVEGARRIAEAAAKYDVPRLIHVSSYNADIDSPSKFYASKAAGEAAVRAIRPDATIVRPGPVYGPEDRLLNNMAARKLWWTTHGGAATILPTYVTDLTAALEKMVYDDATTGQTYELFGPERLSIAELHTQVKDAVKKDLMLVDLPKPVLSLLATFFQYATYWSGPITPDQVERLLIDQVFTPGAQTYADLGITPRFITEDVLPLTHFHRSNTYLSDSPETDMRRKKQNESWANIVQ